jgi:outer membrane scaffolding protein for murein synthesis (MipA/OmpV family)
VVAAAGAAHGAVPEPEPRLEFGLGALVLRVPDYRGSDRYDVQAYPIPYAAYRSERVQLTREGLRARLFTLDRLTASLSAALNLPGTHDNPDRAGMRQIDPTFEAGPSLDYRLLDGADTRVRLRLPVRAAIAADGFRWKAIGWVAVPNAQLDHRDRVGAWDWFYLVSAGAVFATQEYHEYFYEVAPQYADPALSRPAYDARGGYGGARFNVSAALRRDRWRIGAFVSYDRLDGAVFEDSPLVKTENGVLAGIFLTYRLYASGRARSMESETP